MEIIRWYQFQIYVKLQRAISGQFPHARSFVRPGFDENLSPES